MGMLHRAVLLAPAFLCEVAGECSTARVLPCGMGHPSLLLCSGGESVHRTVNLVFLRLCLCGSYVEFVLHSGEGVGRWGAYLIALLCIRDAFG